MGLVDTILDNDCLFLAPRCEELGIVWCPLEPGQNNPVDLYNDYPESTKCNIRSITADYVFSRNCDVGAGATVCVFDKSGSVAFTRVKETTDHTDEPYEVLIKQCSCFSQYSIVSESSTFVEEYTDLHECTGEEGEDLDILTNDGSIYVFAPKFMYNPCTGALVIFPYVLARYQLVTSPYPGPCNTFLGGNDINLGQGLADVPIDGSPNELIGTTLHWENIDPGAGVTLAVDYTFE